MVAAAGPGANLVLALISAALLSVSPLMVGALWINTAALITNLWPARVRAGRRAMQTDGVTVLDAFVVHDSEDARESRTVLRTAVEEALARSSPPRPNAFDLLTALLREPGGRGAGTLHRAGVSVQQARSLASVAGRDGDASPAGLGPVPAGASASNLVRILLARPDVAAALPLVVTRPVAFDDVPPALQRRTPVMGVPIAAQLLADLPLEHLSAEAIAVIQSAQLRAARAEEPVSSASLLRALSEQPGAAARALHAIGFTGAHLPPPASSNLYAPGGYSVVVSSVLALGLTSPLFATGQPIGTASLLIGVWLYDQDGVSSRLEARGLSFMALVSELLRQASAPPPERSCQDSPERTLRWLVDLRAHACLALGRYGAAFEGFRALGACAPNEQSVAIALNNAAWAGLMSDDPALWRRALELSTRAHALLPAHEAVRGTHAFALIENGRAADGVRLLAPYVRHATPVNRLLQSCVMAIGLSRVGMTADAQRFLDQARRLDPEVALLRRATAAVASP